eukprot:TRINITY_DN4206_c0_g1_i2.p1 TRINITY_DN4206_c0_g1~~TRINITY_DN4206_c0_g1_i2.p1  ORF type:complete len:341 (+),score=89.66 TRINITY_DN4206_c0_g1_i2:120-1142(+)
MLREPRQKDLSKKQHRRQQQEAAEKAEAERLAREAAAAAVAAAAGQKAEEDKLASEAAEAVKAERLAKVAVENDGRFQATADHVGDAVLATKVVSSRPKGTKSLAKENKKAMHRGDWDLQEKRKVNQIDDDDILVRKAAQAIEQAQQARCTDCRQSISDSRDVSGRLVQEPESEPTAVCSAEACRKRRRLTGKQHATTSLVRTSIVRFARLNSPDIRTSIGHVLAPPEQGCLVRVHGDGWGGQAAGGDYLATVTESDPQVFTVVRRGDCTGDSWEETHVLREHCTILARTESTCNVFLSSPDATLRPRKRQRTDRKSTRLNSSHTILSRMPSSKRGRRKS